MRHDYPIQLRDGTTWTIEQRNNDSQGWQAALHKNHGISGKDNVCQCRQTGTRLYSFSRGGTAGLAKYPDTGHYHVTDCRYWAARKEESGRTGYDEEAITEDENGNLAVRLRFPMTRRLKDPAPPAAPATPRPAAQNRPSTITELGLLHLLWEEAGLHSWVPRYSARNWATVRNLLLEAAAKIHRQGFRIIDRLVVIPGMFGPNVHAQVQKDFIRKVTHSHATADQVERIFIIGQLSGMEQAQGQVELKMHFAKSQKLQLRASPALAASFKRRFAGVEAILRGDFRADKDMIVALLVAEVSKTKGGLVADVVSGAHMPTTARFIPYASSYERTVANRLVDQCRMFMKPLRFDADEALLPDFILQDSTPNLPMEVYGRNDEAYLARKAEKRKLYEKLYGPGRVWEWEVDPARSSAVPPFPPPV
jgi:hypothetical protein